MKNIVVVGGAGKWGQNYLNTLSLFNNLNVQVAGRDNWKVLIDEEPDGVIVTTRPDSHIEIASYALERKIPTVIEKPLALSLREAKALEKFDTPIIVNHINLFTESYEEMVRVINRDKITEIKTNGFGKGPVREHSSLWDYGPHCLSLILYLAGKLPKTVLCTSNTTSQGELFTIMLDFENFQTTSIVGNGGLARHRTIQVSYNGLTIGYNDVDRPAHHKPPMQNMLELFINQRILDDRFGLDLSFKILKVLDCCVDSLIKEAMIYTS